MNMKNIFKEVASLLLCMGGVVLLAHVPVVGSDPIAVALLVGAYGYPHVRRALDKVKGLK